MQHIDHQLEPRRAVLYFRKAGTHRATREPALRAYAAEHGLTIVRVYADEDEFGERQALGQLQEDIASATRAFDVILHFDATAWGRNTHADTASMMKYLCREHGVDVVYLHAPAYSEPCPLIQVNTLTPRRIDG